MLLSAAAAATVAPKIGELAVLDSSLISLSREFADFQQAHAPAPFASGNSLLRIRDNSILIEAYAVAGHGDALLTDLKKLKMNDAHLAGNEVGGWLPIGQIHALAALHEVTFVRPVALRLATGSVNSQGDAALRADIERSTYGYTGAGIKVGVLSDSFDTGPGSYATDISTGDLPAGVQVLQDAGGGSDEGRAMAQLVYDSAPGVSLAFATAYNTQSNFANNIKALRDAGAKVIVDDVIYFAEPMFQDGVIAQAVDNVVATGVSYFSAAGNEGRQAWESAFRTGRTLSAGAITAHGNVPSFLGGVTHDFDPGPGLDDMQQFTLSSGQQIQLSFQWDQPYGTIPGSASSAVDMDIYVLNAAGTQVVGGANSLNAGAGKDPVEIFSFANNGQSTQTYNLMIVKHTGATDPVDMKYVNFYDQTFTEYNTNSGPLYGHPNASGAAAVGAAAWFDTPAYGTNPPVLEYYSSAGPTPIYYSTTGTRLGAAVTRQRPNFVAPDGGNTSFFYSDSTTDPDTIPNFFGTSAAAPAAASVAALMLSANPSLTPAQVYSALQNTALDMSVAGYDSDTGYGLVRADAAVASILPPGAVSGAVFRDINANGTNDSESGITGVTVYLDTNNNGSLDGGESSTATIAGGAFTFSSLAPGSYNVREVVPSGYVATTATASISVTSGATTTRNLGNFPITYGGSSGTDTYTIRTDPGDSTRLQVLESLSGGATTTYSIAKSILTAASASFAFNTGNSNDSLTYAGPLTYAVAFGGGSGSDTLSVNGGTFSFNSDAVLSTSSLTINVNSGSALFNASQHLASIVVASGTSATMAANGNRYLQTKALTINGTGRLDLNDNDLIIDYTAAAPFTTTQGYVVAGLSGPQGITSTVRDNTSAPTIHALFDNAPIGLTEWPLGSGNTIDPSTLIAKYTYFGDVNIDGIVNDGDYGVIDANYNSAPSSNVAILFGDANMDGIVNDGDYGVIDANYGLGVGNPL